MDDDEWEETVYDAVERLAEALVEADDRGGARAVRVASGHAAAPGEAIERALALVVESGAVAADHPAVRELERLAAGPNGQV